MTIKEFCFDHNKEIWNGQRTAFANGVSCRVFMLPGNYKPGGKGKLYDAWLRGWKAADLFTASGGKIEMEGAET